MNLNPLSNFVISLIRTYVPALVGAAISWLALRGVEVTDDMRLLSVTMLTGLAMAAYYTIARTIETKWPILGRILLGSKQAPTYQLPADQYFETPDRNGE